MNTPRIVPYDARVVQDFLEFYRSVWGLGRLLEKRSREGKWDKEIGWWAFVAFRVRMGLLFLVARGPSKEPFGTHDVISGQTGA